MVCLGPWWECVNADKAWRCKNRNTASKDAHAWHIENPCKHKRMWKILKPAALRRVIQCEPPLPRRLNPGLEPLLALPVPSLKGLTQRASGAKTIAYTKCIHQKNMTDMPSRPQLSAQPYRNDASRDRFAGSDMWSSCFRTLSWTRRLACWKRDRGPMLCTLLAMGMFIDWLRVWVCTVDLLETKDCMCLASVAWDSEARFSSVIAADRHQSMHLTAFCRRGPFTPILIWRCAIAPEYVAWARFYLLSPLTWHSRCTTVGQFSSAIAADMVPRHSNMEAFIRRK